MLKLQIKLISAFIIVLVSGCQSIGSIQGTTGGSQVKLDYQQGLFENDGTLKVTMPGGEIFTGKFVQNSSARTGSDWEIGESSNDDNFILTSLSERSSQAEAILIGDRGNTMTCKFQFSDPEAGIDGGGIGSCMTSTDQSISMAF